MKKSRERRLILDLVDETEEVRDPLTTTALAISSEDGAQVAIIVSLDAIAPADLVIAGCRNCLVYMHPVHSFTPIFG